MSPIAVTKDNFEKEVLDSKTPVLVDFWASWCAPCRMLAPVIDEIANENENIKVVKVDVDDQPELALQFKIQSIPTVLALKDGKVLSQLVGVRPKEQIIALFE